MRALALGLLLATTAPAAAAGIDAAAIEKAVAADWSGYLAPLYDHFHRNPELSFVEVNTAARMAKELRAVKGMEVTEKVGGTGVVGVLRNGPGPTILLRADMDGLPLEEASGLPNASKVRQANREGVVQPVMHACGHDTHITGLVGTARRLAALRDQWSGTLVFVVQPAEERISGARLMVEDGFFTRFPKADYALGWNVDADSPTGTLGVAPGLVSSSSDTIDITVHGVGSHGASPHQGKDPVVMGSQIVMALQTLPSREIDPLQPAVVTVGAFHAGAKHNIISDKAELLLTVRADSQTVRDQLVAGIERIAKNVGRMNGMPEDRLPTVKVSDERTIPTMNDPDLTARLRTVFAGAFGPKVLNTVPREGMGAEDYPYLVAPGVKSVYFTVGGTPQAAFDAAKAGGPPVSGHHSPFFKVDGEASVKLGAQAMTVAVLELAPRKPL
jgi:hippurate hydrolase